MGEDCDSVEGIITQSSRARKVRSQRSCMNGMHQLIVFLPLCRSQLWSSWPHSVRTMDSGSWVSLLKLAAILHERCGLDSLHFVNYYVLSNLHTLRFFISTDCECSRFWQTRVVHPQWQFYIMWFLFQIYCGWTPLPKCFEITSMVTTLCFTIL